MGSSNDTTGALLAIRPQSPQVEFIQFLTDVIPTYNGLEQRRRLRRYPRHSLSNQYLEQNTERANQMKNQFTQDPSQSIAQPFWFESTFLSSLPTTGTNSLTVSTAYANYQIGGYAMIWESAENYEILLIAEVNAESLVFSSNIVNTYTQLPHSLPLFYMLPSAPIAWTEHLNHTLFDYEATTTTPLDVDEWEYADNYIGTGIFPYDCNLFESNSTPVTIENNTYGMDNGTGIFTSDSTFDVSHRQFIVGINPRTREDCWKLRRVIEGLKGRQKAIWIPSFNEDLTASEDLDGLNIIKVYDNGFADIFRDYTTYAESAMYNRIAISYADGSVEYKEIESLTVSGGVIDLTLTSSATAAQKEAVKIMLLYYARLSSDVLEIEWVDSTNCFCRLPFVVTGNAPSEVIAGQFALESDGGQWIDLDTTILDENDFVCNAAFNNLAFDNTQTIGGVSTYATGGRRRYIGQRQTGGSIYYGWGSIYGDTSITITEGQFYKFEKRADEYLVDDALERSSFTDASETTAGAALFAIGRDATVEENASADIEDFYLWTDSARTTYVRNMWAVPEGRTALGASSSTTSDIGTVVINGIAPSNCTYCAAEDKYRENRGTGSFTIKALI